MNKQRYQDEPGCERLNVSLREKVAETQRTYEYVVDVKDFLQRICLVQQVSEGLADGGAYATRADNDTRYRGHGVTLRVQPAQHLLIHRIFRQC